MESSCITYPPSSPLFSRHSEPLQKEVHTIFILRNNQQMHLCAVKFIPLLGSLYMFWVFHTPIIRSTIFNFIYSHWYKP